MADNIGGVSAAAGAAVTAGTTGTTSAAPATGQVGSPTPAAIQNATPSASQTPGAPKMYDVKVDGQVVRMSEAELLQSASLGKAAFKRMEEANVTKRQAEAFIEKFRRDPMAALEDPALGLNDQQRRDAIEKYYKTKFIDQDKLSPEQRELQKAQLEIKKYKDKESAEIQQREQAQKQQLEGQYREHYQKVILDALETAGLPKTAHTVGRMAFYMSQAQKNKINAPMEVIVNQVREDYQEQFRAFTQNSPAEALVNFLGPDAAKKIQRYALEQHKKKLAEGFTPPEPKTQAIERKKPVSNNGDGWRKVSNYWTRNDK